VRIDASAFDLTARQQPLIWTPKSSAIALRLAATGIRAVTLPLEGFVANSLKALDDGSLGGRSKP
jgi:hypothetical protein